MTRWTDADDRKLRQLAGTTSAAAIGQALGRSEEAVYGRAKRIGVRLIGVGQHHHSAKHSDALVESARDMHDAGIGPAAISRKLGMNVNTVKTIIAFRSRIGVSQYEI